MIYVQKGVKIYGCQLRFCLDSTMSPITDLLKNFRVTAVHSGKVLYKIFQHWKKDWYDQIPYQSSKCKPVTYPSQAHPFPPLFCQHPSLFLLVFHSRSSLFLQELRPVDWRLSRSGSPWRRSLCRRWTRLHPARLMSLALMLWLQCNQG